MHTVRISRNFLLRRTSHLFVFSTTTLYSKNLISSSQPNSQELSFDVQSSDNHRDDLFDSLHAQDSAKLSPMRGRVDSNLKVSSLNFGIQRNTFFVVYNYESRVIDAAEKVPPPRLSSQFRKYG